MAKSVETLKNDFPKVRTGRAHTGLLDHVHVDYYGSMHAAQPVRERDARRRAHDQRAAVREEDDPGGREGDPRSDLGLNPATSGDVIRVPMPALTEERRRDLIKVVHNEAESARVAMRNVRRDANEHLKKMLKDKRCSEDDERHALEDLQKMTDRYIAEIDSVLQAKEADLHGDLSGCHADIAVASPKAAFIRARHASSRRRPTVPRHVAIIMDGNGRWAKQRLLPRVAGHGKGVEAVRAAVRAAIERGIEYLTLFAFSSENWRRPAGRGVDPDGAVPARARAGGREAARERHPRSRSSATWRASRRASAS